MMPPGASVKRRGGELGMHITAHPGLKRWMPDLGPAAARARSDVIQFH